MSAPRRNGDTIECTHGIIVRHSVPVSEWCPISKNPTQGSSVVVEYTSQGCALDVYRLRSIVADAREACETAEEVAAHITRSVREIIPTARIELNWLVNTGASEPQRVQWCSE